MSKHTTRPSTEPAIAQQLMRLFEAEQYHVTYNPMGARRSRQNPLKLEVDYRRGRRKLDASTWQLHVGGRYPLSIAPNLSDDTVTWGAVDIDEYGADLGSWVRKLLRLEISSFAVRTKSGGLRIIVFFGSRIGVMEAVRVLRAICSRLEVPEREIFPREQPPESRPFVVNVPYSGYQSSILERQVALRENGSEIGLAEFVRLAKTRKMGTEERERLLALVPPLARRPPRRPVRMQQGMPSPEMLVMMKQNAGRGLSSDPDDMRPQEDTDLKVWCALRVIPADVLHDDWTKIGFAIYAALGDNGFEHFDEWSREAPSKYPGHKAIQDKWRECAKVRSVREETVYWFADQYDRSWRDAYRVMLAKELVS